MDAVTIMLAAKDIPDGTVVRKPAGEQKYFLRHSIPIYGDNRTIEASELP